MLNEQTVKKLLKQVVNKEGEFDVYNNVFLCGYKVALQEVLEIKRPKGGFA